VSDDDQVSLEPLAGENEHIVALFNGVIELKSSIIGDGMATNRWRRICGIKGKMG
jgi:hypothetical protein